MNPSLLLSHFAAYPLMEPIDAVKLCYQSAFGCAHLIADPVRAENWVRAEISSQPAEPVSPVCTLLGGGMARLNLRQPSVRQIPPEKIVKMMTLSAQESSPSPEAFYDGLRQVRELALAGQAPFSADELDRFLESYPRETLPPVSHSAAYRDEYLPSYRVLRGEFCALLPLILLAEERLSAGKPVLFALDGPCASGKTTLAGFLSRLYDTEAISIDDFFLPPLLRTAERLSTPGGNVHYERFLSEVLLPLRNGGDFTFKAWDCHSGQTAEKRHLSSPVTVIEGSYSHHPAFAESYRELNVIKVFVRISPQQQLSRLQKRNPATLERFVDCWVPLEKKYFEAYDISRGADLRISTLPREGCSLLPPPEEP